MLLEDGWPKVFYLIEFQKKILKYTINLVSPVAYLMLGIYYDYPIFEIKTTFLISLMKLYTVLHANITRGLYTFYPIFESQKRF